MQTRELNKQLAVLATGILTFSGVLIETAMNVTFPDLIAQYSISTKDVQWVTTIYLLMISMMVPLSNDLMKRFSIRKLFMSANLLFLIGVVLNAIASTFGLLLLGRLLQGIGTGIALPLMFHIILTYYPLEKRGTMIGVGTLTTAIAPAIGPTYGGFLSSVFTWHAIYLCLIPVLLCSLVIGLRGIPEISVALTSKLDVPGLIGIGCFFTGSLLFLNQLTQPIGWIGLAFAMMGFGLFFYRVKTTKHPLVRLDVMKQKSFRIFLFGFLVCQFLLLGISFILPNYVQFVLGKTSFIAGLMMLPGALVGALLAPVAGNLFDRRGPKYPILLGLSIACIGWLSLALFMQMAQVSLLVLGHVVFMIGNGLCYSNMMTIGMNQLAKEAYSDGNTIYNTLQQFSGAIATTIVAVILGFFQTIPNTSIVQGTISGSIVSVLTLSLLLLSSLIASSYYFLRRKK